MPASPALRQPFFDAAFALLAEGGYTALKQAAVCRALDVSTGSFYHSFASWKVFTDALLEHWRAEQTTRLVELTERENDPLDRLLLLIDVTLTLPHRAEAAIRLWSAIDPDVGVIQAEIDRERHRVVRDAFRQLLGDPGEAERRAAAGLFLLIGYEQQDDADPEHLRWALRLLLQDVLARRVDPVVRYGDHGHNRTEGGGARRVTA